MASHLSAPRRVPGGVHPHVVSDFTPKTKLKVPSIDNAKRYGSLDDDSSYSEYAWEFLRRNRFYQSMVDEETPVFDLNQWGYRPSPEHEVGFGLKKIKHYNDSHADAVPYWTPIAVWVARMQRSIDHFKHPSTQIEYPGTQVAVVFDLAPVLGPGTVALQTQANLAVKFLERLVIERAESSAKSINAKAEVDGWGDVLPVASKLPAEPVNKPAKRLLREYLMIADLLSPNVPALDDSLPVDMSRPKPKMFTIIEAARLLPYPVGANGKKEKRTDSQLEDRAYRCAEEAWRLIYGWECLNLLKFEEWIPG